MKQFLITGGAGFIGMALAEQLHSEGHEVHILDRSIQIEKLGSLADGLILHQNNVANPESFRALPKINFDTAFHLAAQTSARVSEETPDEDINSNVKGTLNFCNWVREAKPRRSVFTSSMAIYGASGDDIIEDTHPTPVSVYGVTKNAGEHFVRILKEEGHNIQIYRLFNVYGPGQDFHNMSQGMLSIFLTQAITRGRIEITGSLDRYRDFVYVTDVIDALRIEPKGPRPWIFNVGTGKAILVRELVQSIIDIVRPIQPGCTFQEIDGHRGDVIGNYANTRLLESLGWKPKVSLDEGLIRTFEDAVRVLAK